MKCHLKNIKSNDYNVVEEKWGSVNYNAYTILSWKVNPLTKPI
jgi:hypothetical protein